MLILNKIVLLKVSMIIMEIVNRKINYILMMEIMIVSVI